MISAQALFEPSLGLHLFQHAQSRSRTCLVDGGGIYAVRQDMTCTAYTVLASRDAEVWVNNGQHLSTQPALGWVVRRHMPTSVALPHPHHTHLFLVADCGGGGLNEGDVVAAQKDAAEGLDLMACMSRRSAGEQPRCWGGGELM